MFLASEAHKLGLAIGLKNGLVSWRPGAEGRAQQQDMAARYRPARRTTGDLSWAVGRCPIRPLCHGLYEACFL